MLTLLDGATSTGAGNPVRCNGAHRAFHAYVDGTSSPNADVDIEVSNDKDGPWVSLFSFTTLTAANQGDANATTGPFAYVRANLTGVSVNGEAVTVTVQTDE